MLVVQVAVGSPVVVAVVVVPLWAMPHCSTGRLGAVQRSLVGVALTVKLVAEVAVPPAAATVMRPLVAPAGTTNVSCVVLVAENVVAAVPLSWTPVTPVKPVPVTVTVAPTAPLAGVNEVIVGRVTVKLPALVPVPTEFVTESVPVVAPVGTVAVRLVAEPTVNAALVPLKLTLVAPVKPVPVTVTRVPMGPAAGVKLVMATGPA